MIQFLEKAEVRQQAAELNIDQYHLLIENGQIAPDVELLNGVLIKKMPKSPLHVYLLHKLFSFFTDKLPTNHLLRTEQPLTLLNSEPEPDLVIVQGRAEDFIDAHPQVAELVLEIAFTSLFLDKEKAAIYAQAKIPEYIILDGEKRQILHYTEPVGSSYMKQNSYGFTQNLSLKFSNIQFSAKQFWPEK